VINLLENHKISELDMLIKLILTLPSEIEKLFAIYYYACHHILYDVDSLSKGNIQPT
jgi:hypothetical protein